MKILTMAALWVIFPSAALAITILEAWHRHITKALT